MWADLRLLLAYVLVSLPACTLGYAWEAAVIAFRKGREKLNADVYGR